jgi:hypothetical protein
MYDMVLVVLEERLYVMRAFKWKLKKISVN